MVDDLAAAFFTLVLLSGLKLLAPAIGDWLGFRNCIGWPSRRAEALKASGRMLVTAESCTGGWVAEA